MRLAILAILLFSTGVMHAQSTLYNQIDSASYAQYKANDLPGMRKTLKLAKQNDIDYYYLQLCAGSVFYNNGKYEKAESHFKRALIYFPVDSLAREYLYYSQLYNGNTFEAQSTGDRLLPSQKERLGYKLKGMQSVSLIGGYGLSDNEANNSNINLWQPGVIFGETRQLNNTGFVQLSMVNNLSKSVKLISAYTYTGLSTKYHVRGPLFDSADTYTTHQNSLYLSPVFYLGKGYSIAPAVHLTHYGYTAFRRAYESGTPKNTIDTVRATVYYVGTEFSKRFTCGNASVSVGYSNLDGINKFVHGDVGVVYYPLGNNKLYGISRVLFLHDGLGNYFALNQKIGFKLAKKLWAELGIAKGQFRYFAENNGLVIYNIPDEITMKASSTLNYYPNDHVNLFIGYTYLQRQGSYMHSFAGSTNSIYNTYYNNHFITTGITFTP